MLLLALAAQAVQPQPGELKTFGDWTVGCDNARACRAVALVLVKLAQLAADLPEVRELDINPLLADRDGVLALDARVAIAEPRRLHKGRGHPRFAIFPYPTEWERHIHLSDGGKAFVRPVRPEDDALFRAFYARVTDEDLRSRYDVVVLDQEHVGCCERGEGRGQPGG